VLNLVPKKDPNALPPKPTEEWTYLKELENKSVDVDIPAGAMVSAGPNQMQCASFRQEEQANQMKANIAFQGIDAQVHKVAGTTGVWYKVILGPYDNKRAAEKHKHIMQNSRINGCQILLM
jgi:cell division protein FtsN